VRRQAVAVFGKSSTRRTPPRRSPTRRTSEKTSRIPIAPQVAAPSRSNTKAATVWRAAAASAGSKDARPRPPQREVGSDALHWFIGSACRDQAPKLCCSSGWPKRRALYQHSPTLRDESGRKSRASNALRRKSSATLAGSDGVRPFDLRTAVMTMLVSHARSVEDFVLRSWRAPGRRWLEGVGDGYGLWIVICWSERWLPPMSGPSIWSAQFCRPAASRCLA